MEGRIKCVISEKGIIIPIHNIALVDVRTHYIWSNADAENRTHYIWSNADAENSNHGHKLSDDQYDALSKELEIIGKY